LLSLSIQTVVVPVRMLHAIRQCGRHYLESNAAVQPAGCGFPPTNCHVT
jgi:hypothetical protein